jgi:transposase InsO family protein
LLAVQPKQFVTTTDSNHALEIYLNLAARMKLTGIDQLWVSDITYIRLLAEFVYLAVILDAFSRKVVGWMLERTLTSRLATEALQKAIALRKPLPGLVHHSDRGVQYASAEYVAILREHEMVPSMSRPANPYDNASCESFIKTLKREEIYANEYADLEEVMSKNSADRDHDSSCRNRSLARSKIIEWKLHSNQRRNVCRSRCSGQAEGTRYQPLSCSSKILRMPPRRPSRASSLLSHSGNK